MSDQEKPNVMIPIESPKDGEIAVQVDSSSTQEWDQITDKPDYFGVEEPALNEETEFSIEPELQEDDDPVGRSYEQIGPHVNYKLTDIILAPHPKPEKFKLNEALFMIGNNWDEYTSHFTDQQAIQFDEMAKGDNYLDLSRDDAIWLSGIYSSVNHISLNNNFKATVERDGADWRQYGEHNGKKIWANRRTVGVPSGAELRGADAVQVIRQAIGVGTMVNIPLWHSGIWITIRTPGNIDCWALEQAIQNEKEILGRQTHGLVFSNSSVYLNRIIVDFVLKHVEDSTLQSWTKDLLKETILLADIQQMAWGMLCAMYPTGYDYSRPCTADMDGCHHVTKELISLTKLNWVDISNIPDSALSHMSLRTANYPLDIIRNYQEKLREGIHANVVLKPNLSFTFKQPTLKEHLESGETWIKDIMKQFDSAFTDGYSHDERDQYLGRLSRVTRARLYSHYYKEIVFTNNEGDTQVVVDREAINVLLDDFTNDPDLADTLLESVKQYIENYSISIIGIPNYACPACGKQQQDAAGIESTIIPVEVIGVFFTLMQQRLTRIQIQSETLPTAGLV